MTADYIKEQRSPLGNDIKKNPLRYIVKQRDTE